MRIFLAGASGVLGRELIPLLLQAGHQVTGMSRSEQRAAQIRAQGADAVVCEAFDQGVKDGEAAPGLDSPPPMSDAIQAVAELERQVLGAEGIVLRYGFFYGPGTQFALDGFYAELPAGSGDGRWSFGHVEDAATATLAALERGAPGIYNPVDDDPTPARESGMTTQRAARNTKAKRDLAWTPRYPSWRDGFGATAT